MKHALTSEPVKSELGRSAGSFIKNKPDHLVPLGDVFAIPDCNSTTPQCNAQTMLPVRRHMNKLLILILLFSAFVPHAQGAHYFVSATGNDGNNGTSTSTPWKTITKVNNTNFAAGDIISFQDGQSFNGNLVLTESGTAAAPITINSYGTGKAEILAGTGVGIYLHNNKNIRVTAFKVTGSGVSDGGIFNDGVQLLYDNSSTAVLTSIYIDQVEVNGFRQAGIAFTPAELTADMTI